MSKIYDICPICEAAIENSNPLCPQCDYNLEEDFWASLKERAKMRQQARQAWQAPATIVEPAATPPQRLEKNHPRIGYEKRYLDLGDGTVIDTITSLQWMRCALGQTWKDNICVGVMSRYTWNEILQATNDMNSKGGFDGHRDWRIPTIEELKTLILCTSGQPKTWNGSEEPCQGKYQSPTICQVAFPNTSFNWFWSVSSHADSSNSAWGINFSHGYANYRNKGRAYAVQLVRSGQ